MSRTDKDRPYWVRVFDYNIIDHDHRSGECTVESIDYARGVTGGAWGRRGYHRSTDCNKSYQVTEYCTKREPHSSTYAVWSRTGARFRDRECWTWRCRCDVSSWRRHSRPSECPTWGRVQCEGHTRWVRDNSIPCVCDDWPERPTCHPTEPADWRWSAFGGGGVPKWYVDHVWNNPERRRERDDLRAARDLYNSGDDLEDYDFPNYPSRKSAARNYH